MKLFKQENIKEAAEILKNGGLIAFPTETVFGLGVVFDDEDAYKRLNLVKRRPPEKPYTLMCASPEDIFKYAEVNNISNKLINKYMPGQFTLITKGKTELPKWCVSSEGTVGVRVPDLKVIRELIKLVGKPLLVPSANKSGENPANTSGEVISIFENEIDAVIEGEANSKTPSTIVLVEGKDVKMIREGIIKFEEIKKEIEKWEL